MSHFHNCDFDWDCFIPHVPLNRGGAARPWANSVHVGKMF